MPLEQAETSSGRINPRLCSRGSWESISKYWLARVDETEADTGTPARWQVHIYTDGGLHICTRERTPTRRVLTHTRKDGPSLVVSRSGTGEVADTHSGGIFAIKVGPVAIFPLTAQAKYQGTVRCCFAPLVELIRCSQRTALSSHCSAHNTASVALRGKQRAKITQRIT